MAALQVQIRIGNKARVITLDGPRVNIGRSKSASLVLPFDWVMQHHLVIENSDASLRIKLGSPDAQARMGNRELTTEWSPLSSPAQVEIPMPRGQPLRLDLTATHRESNAAIVRHGAGDPEEQDTPANDALGVKMARAEGIGSGGWGGGGGGSSTAGGAQPGAAALASIESASLPEPGLLVRAPRLIVSGYAGIF